MKIFFTATTSKNNESLQKNYKAIFSFLKRSKFEIISGNQIVDVKILKKDEKVKEKNIFEREKGLIDKADIVIAEVSHPSTAVGGQIVYSLMKNKPVLALIYKENEDEITPMLLGNPSENLFLEHYDLDNLKYVISEFTKHIKHIKKRKGKLIVIDGADGSGKATQAKLLIDHFKKNKIPVKYIDFPRYYLSFHGATVAKFLRGEFGTIDQVSPYLASLAYALDRASAKDEIEEFLNKGGIVIANRYATSNMGHQMAKFKTDKEKQDFYKWEYDLEYKTHKIPKEDLVIYLHVPYQISFELTKKKDDRKYLNGKKTDIHESDMNYRIKVESTFLELAEKNKHWKKIDCTKNNKMLSIEEIQKKILEEVKRIL